MEKEHLEIIRTNLVRLGKDLYLDEDVLNYMASERIITDSMREEIDAAPTKSKKNSTFITLLKKRGPKAFKTFIFALMETSQDDLAYKLHSGYADEWKRESADTDVTGTHIGASDPRPGMETHETHRNTYHYTNQMSEDPESDDEGIDMSRKGMINVEVRNININDHERTKHFFNPSNKVYKMNSPKRGRALIINNKNFPSSSQPERHGTDIDATNIDQLLGHLGYITRLVGDLTAMGIAKTLNEESQSPEHVNYDSFVCVILSHGGLNTICGVDGEDINIDDITTPFDNSHCPALAGKPKLFIIQACQGKEYDRGAYKSEATDADGEPVSEVTKQLDEMSIKDDQPKMKNLSKMPSKGDMLIAFPTYAGYRSWRNAEFGTWYIRAVVEVFMKYAYKLHVEQLLKKVRRKIAKTETISEAHYKQMPADYVSFQKDMYFFPGLSLAGNTGGGGSSSQPYDN